jgi:hypothetical protein
MAAAVCLAVALVVVEGSDLWPQPKTMAASSAAVPVVVDQGITVTAVGDTDGVLTAALARYQATLRKVVAAKRQPKAAAGTALANIAVTIAKPNAVLDLATNGTLESKHGSVCARAGKAGRARGETEVLLRVSGPAVGPGSAVLWQQKAPALNPVGTPCACAALQ